MFPSDSKAYNPSLSSRETTADINTRVAFQHAASPSVAYWPIPVLRSASKPLQEGLPRCKYYQLRPQCGDARSHTVSLARRRKYQLRTRYD
ncbi:DUF2875 family protein [Pseudomonas syringae]|nr:DUF2875 family protein [Pseudomonas syringae]